MCDVAWYSYLYKKIDNSEYSYYTGMMIAKLKNNHC